MYDSQTDTFKALVSKENRFLFVFMIIYNFDEARLLKICQQGSMMKIYNRLHGIKQAFNCEVCSNFFTDNKTIFDTHARTCRYFSRKRTFPMMIVGK